MMGYQFGKFKRVRSDIARRMFGLGSTIYVQSSNMRPDSVWQPAYQLKQNEDFEKQINAYVYYNCDNERGKNIFYYMEA